MKQNITNYNANGQYHGYQEWYAKQYVKNNEDVYTYTNILYYRTNYKNDEPIGYDEWHSEKLTQYHIK